MTGYWKICLIKVMLTAIESIGNNNNKKISKFRCILMFMPVSFSKTVS